MDIRLPDEGQDPTFLVERYWPGIDEALLLDALPRLERAALEMAAEGSPVSHVGSLLVAEDQVVFSLIRAASEDQVREVNDRARMPVDRISTVSSHGFETAAGVPAAREGTTRCSGER